MNYASVVRILSALILVLAGSALLPALVAGIRGETAQLFAFLTLALIASVVAASVLLLTPKPTRRAVPSDALGVVIIWWLVVPIIAGFPFVLGTANSSVLSGIHEAMSCLTTTGHSVIEIGTDGWPDSLVAWRGVLHILGALASIITAASVFAAMNLGGPGIHRTVLFTLPEKSFFDTVPRVASAVAIMMGVALLATLGGLLLAGQPFGDAASLAISAITTGLVHPDAATAPAPPPFPAIILAVALGFGTLGLAALLPFRERRLSKLVRDPEAQIMLSVLLILIGLLVLAGQSVVDGAAWALSALSTSGLPLNNSQLADTLPLPILILPALIGGSALSAAGGVKLARIIILARRAGQEFRQLGYRSSIVSFQFRGRAQEESTIIGVWVYLIAYIATVFACICGFGLLGMNFDQAIGTAVAGMTNSGGLMVDNGQHLQPGESALMIVAMLLGRLEILAIIPALVPGFWRG